MPSSARSLAPLQRRWFDDAGNGTAVGPAQGFHYTVPESLLGVIVTNVGNSIAGHVDVEFPDGSTGTRSGAWVEQLSVIVGHTSGYFGVCYGLDCG